MAYFYEHTNGAVIEKPDMVVDRGGGPLHYFDSPFVNQWWQESDFLRPIKEAQHGQSPKTQL